MSTMTSEQAREVMLEWCQRIRNQLLTDGRNEHVKLFDAVAIAALGNPNLSQPAQAVDVGAIHEVIEELRSWDAVYEGVGELAKKLARAIGNAQAEGWKVPAHVLKHARHMVDGHYPSHREYQVADALLKLSPTPPQPEE